MYLGVKIIITKTVLKNYFNNGDNKTLIINMSHRYRKSRKNSKAKNMNKAVNVIGFIRKIKTNIMR